MDLHKAFVASIVAGGVPAFKAAQEKGVQADFLQGPAKTAYEFIVDFYGTYRDIPSLEAIMGRTNVQLAGEAPKEPVEFFADEVLNLRLFTQIQAKTEAISAELKARKPQEAYRVYTDGLTALRKEGLATQKVISLPSLGPDFLKYYELIKSGHRGIETPWPTINDATLGFWPEDFVLFVARLGVGKTWTLVHLMLDAWHRQKKRVLFVTTEMSREKIQQRWYAAHFRLPYDDLRRGQLGEFGEKKLREGIEETMHMSGLDIVGGEFDFTMDALEAAIDESEPDLVIVDGAYLINASGDGRTERAANSFDELKRCAKRNKIPLVASTQFNREAKTDKKDTVSVEKIALSDAAGWNGDLIFGLVQTEELKKDARMMIKPLKFREGVGSDIMCNWNFETMDFSEIPKDFDFGATQTSTPRKDISTGSESLFGDGSDDNKPDDWVPF